MQVYGSMFMENVDVDGFWNQCNTITICIYKEVYSSYNIDLKN